MEVGDALDDAVVPGVAAPPLKFKPLVGLNDFVTVFGRKVCRQRAVEIFVVEPKIEFESNVGAVFELEVDVIVGKRGAASKWYCAVDIRENIKTMPPTFLDC